MELTDQKKIFHEIKARVQQWLNENFINHVCNFSDIGEKYGSEKYAYEHYTTYTISSVYNILILYKLDQSEFYTYKHETNFI